MNASLKEEVYNLVNGVSGDPSVFSFFPLGGDALLFDLGSIDRLSNKNILKARHAFISHTHIDHFIGFDRLLRVNIPHFKIMNIVGPKGVIENVSGKLQGYTWNLLDPGQITFVVRELSSTGEIRSVLLSNDSLFQPTITEDLISRNQSGLPEPEKPARAVAVLRDGSRVDGVSVDHGVSSLSFSVQSPIRAHVKTEELSRLGLKPGPWISKLQDAVRDCDFNRKIAVSGKVFKAEELSSQILWFSAPKSIGYVTDLCFSWENLRRLKLIHQKVETLICETSFADRDRGRAHAKKHLTTRQAAMIAAYVGASNLQPFHISNIYSGLEDEIVAEALTYFDSFRGENLGQLEVLISKEIDRQ